MRGFVWFVLLISAFAVWFCFSPAAPPVIEAQTRPQSCPAAIVRLQTAIKKEAYAYANLRREVCHFHDLSEDEKAGRPQAVFDSLQSSYKTALNETAAARKAAQGCDTSKVKGPRISTTDPNFGNIFNTCVFTNLPDVEDHEARSRAFAARSEACAAALEKINCESTRIIEDDAENLVFSDVNEIIVPPANLEPVCRPLYVEAENARRDYEKARKRVHDFGNYSSMGPRGEAMYRSTVENEKQAATKYYKAKDALDNCPGDDAGKKESAATMPGVRSCSPEERRAFANFSGVWNGYRTHLTISGSCEEVTGDVTWIEYCEGIDQPYNKTLPSYKGTIKGGRMAGASISLPWTQPASGPHKASTGTGNCTVSGGTINCTGFGCAMSATR